MSLSVEEWSCGVIKLVDSLNNFYAESNLIPLNMFKKLNLITKGSSRNKCYSFVLDGKHLGYIRSDVLNILRKHYNDKFLIKGSHKIVTLIENIDTFEKRTKLFHQVLSDMKEKNLFSTLKGWRNECYAVKQRFNETPLFEIERSGVAIFGFCAYGCHINGYVKNKSEEYKMWIAKRSPNKQTFPGMLDNLAAGGLTSGLGLFECALKECEEESSIPKEISSKLVQVNAISYAYENDYGINKEVEFVFDLELPTEFMPKISDGEVESFELMTIDKVKKAIISGNFKPNSAAITLDFLMRKGLINAENDPNYLYILEKLHSGKNN